LDRKDKISDNYRKQVDELLDSQSDPNLFDQLNQEELDTVWEEISTEMDIGEVWNEISSDLDIIMPVDSGPGIIFKSFAAVLIILIGMIPVKKVIMSPGISHSDILIETRQNKQSADLIIENNYMNSVIEEQVKGDISSALKSSLDKSKDNNKRNPAERNRTGLTHGASTPVSNWVGYKVLKPSGMVDSNLVISPDKIPVEKSGIHPVIFPCDLERIKLSSKTGPDSLKIKGNSLNHGFSIQSINKGRISLGLITSFRNTWLINQETLNGFKSESLNTTEIVFFPDAGLSLSYSLNKNWLLQADGFFSSNTGQQYRDYIYGHYSRKKITLNYSTIDLSIKHKFIGSGNLMPRSSINVLAGGYISFLHYAYQKINADLENIGSQYEKYDLGVRLGCEIELHLYDNISFAPGLFLSMGIPNIYKGDSYNPGYLRRTHNGSAEFHLTFYYHFD
jgi:hypothetical protein